MDTPAAANTTPATLPTPLNSLFHSATAAGLCLVLMVLIAYFPALRAGFVWDDNAITDNILLRTFGGLWKIWSAPSLIPNEVHYWPLVYSSFWLDYRFWGLNPFGYHLTNVLLHALNTILLWVVLRRLAFPGSWLAAAIFALHPVHVESVAWAIERKDVLSGMFYLLSFLLYVRFVDRRKWTLYAAALLLFVCAMLAKSITVSLPLALLLWLWWKGERLERRALLPLLPFFGVAAAIASLDVWFVRHHSSAELGLSVVERALVAGRALWFYAAKLLWPVNLVAHYPRWQLDPHALWQYLFPAAAAAVIVSLWFLRHRVGKAPFAAALFFSFTLGPVLGFVDFGFMKHSFVADRFQYLASISLIALFAGIGANAAARLQKPRLPLVWMGAAILLLTLAVLTWKQAATYQDVETLFRHTLTKNPDSWVAYNSVGLALATQGKLNEAIPYYLQALRVRPDYVAARTNLANALAWQGQFQQAIRHYREALRLKPDYVEAHNNLGLALAKAGDVSQAIAQYRKALQFDPNYATSHINLANLLSQLGRAEEAIVHYQKALRINPYLADAHHHLGIILAEQGKLEQAIEHYLQALRVNPQDAQAHNNLANALSQIGRSQEAIVHYQESLRLKPEEATTLNNLAITLARQGELEQAIDYFSRALRLQPDSDETHYNLALALVKQGNIQEAIVHYREALRLRPDSPKTASSLAWLLATSENPEFRNANEAIQLAQRACEQSGSPNPVLLDTLAAAYAENGQFAQAVQTATQALELARSQGKEELANRIQERLELYRQDKPYHVSLYGPIE